MPYRPLSREEVRAIDACAASEYHLPTLVLMENAGRGAAEWLRQWLKPTDYVIIACGPGNNGGDGNVVARHLDAWGYDVHVAWFTDPDQLRGDAEIQKRIIDASEIKQSIHTRMEMLTLFQNQATWIVDALLGTGLTRPVEGILRTTIEAINESNLPVLALDVPSGLDADSGQPLGNAIRAKVTTTFVAPKLGFSKPGAKDYTGVVEIIDIGIPGKLLRALQTEPEP